MSKPKRVGLRTALACALAVVAAGWAFAAEPLSIGWSEMDITPPFTKRVPLAGQYYQRLADPANPVHSRLKVVAVAMQQGGEAFIEAAIDNVTVWEPWTKRVRARVHERVPEIAPERLFINCIHTHSAPRIRPAGTPAAAKMEREQPDVWGPNEYADFALERVAEACVAAWKARQPGRVRRAFGAARIGHCRLALYADGSSEMYGDTRRSDFVQMLEGEDDGVGMLFTVDARGRTTGVIANVACPSQVMESTHQISSDFAGAARERLKKAFGEDFRMLYQIGAAGCQSPRDLVRRGRNGEHDGWHADTCAMLGERLATCIMEAEAGAVEMPSVLRHACVRLELPRRRVTAAQVAEAKRVIAALDEKTSEKEERDRFLEVVRANEAKDGPGPYDDKNMAYVTYQINKAIVARGKDQDERPNLPIEMHVVRIGDVAFVSNPFELYLAYGQSIKARSAAKQTFIVEKCGSQGYVPTPAAENARGYGGGVNNGEIGHEGAYMYCDEAVSHIGRLFGASAAAAARAP